MLMGAHERLRHASCVGCAYMPLRCCAGEPWGLAQSPPTATRATLRLRRPISHPAALCRRTHPCMPASCSAASPCTALHTQDRSALQETRCGCVLQCSGLALRVLHTLSPYSSSEVIEHCPRCDICLTRTVRALAVCLTSPTASSGAVHCSLHGLPPHVLPV